jgi:hypothetical protein
MQRHRGAMAEYEWGNMEIFQYRACMARHGEVE